MFKPSRALLDSPPPLHLPTRVLGDHQVCLDPVRERAARLPLGVHTCPDLCVPKPGPAHSAGPHGEASSHVTTSKVISMAPEPMPGRGVRLVMSYYCDIMVKHAHAHTHTHTLTHTRAYIIRNLVDCFRHSDRSCLLCVLVLYMDLDIINTISYICTLCSFILYCYYFAII